MTLLQHLNNLAAEAQIKGYYRAEADSALWRALPKFLAMATAARDFMDSDGDYFSWTEDERHCFSRLRDTILDLEETEL